MDHSGRLINLSLQAKSTISHEFDECFVFDYKNYGFSPFFKKYEGKKQLKWNFCNRDKICEDILSKLSEKEPLFKEISTEFQKALFLSIKSEFGQFFEKNDYYDNVSKVNWTIIYGSTRSLLFQKKETLSESDLLLILKLDSFYSFVVNQIEKIIPNFYQIFNNEMKKNDKILYKKIQDSYEKKKVS